MARRLIDTRFVTELPGGARILYSNRENYATLIYNNQLFDFETMLFVLHYLAEAGKAGKIVAGGEVAGGPG